MQSLPGTAKELEFLEEEPKDVSPEAALYIGAHRKYIMVYNCLWTSSSKIRGQEWKLFQDIKMMRNPLWLCQNDAF